MENPITHVVFLATVFLLYSCAYTGAINDTFAIPVFLVSISRIDSAFHIAPLLIIFSAFWLFAWKIFRGLYFSLLVFGLWLTFKYGDTYIWCPVAKYGLWSGCFS